MRFKYTALIVGALSLIAPITGAMSVEDAYRAIPHRRTVFDAGAGRMSSAERATLVRLFALVDDAIVAKVLAGEALARKEAWGPTGRLYAGIEAQLRDLNPGTRLKPVVDQVVSAIEDQRDYFQGRWSGGNTQSKIQSSSAKLHQAYSFLMSLYPDENASNKQAFFDYLCALDFI